VHPKLKLKIFEAIDKTMNDICEEEGCLWEGYRHPELVTQMTEATALVFDSCMEGQRYARQEA